MGGRGRFRNRGGGGGRYFGGGGGYYHNNFRGGRGGRNRGYFRRQRRGGPPRLYKMHPRNIYITPPNIKDLALEYPEFQPFAKQKLDGKVALDFNDRDSLCAFTKVLLKKDFQLSLDLPADRMVPTLPLRLNYLLWIEDILDMFPEEYKKLKTTAPDPPSVHGIDIGTGASCIYALLAAKKNNWKMLATEIDEKSYEYATKNVLDNNLQNQVKIKKVADGTYLDGNVDDGVSYDFSMCNPPFFSFKEAYIAAGTFKQSNRPHPSESFTGSVGEYFVTGGEKLFIRKVIEDSEKLKTRIKVHSIMTGYRATVDQLSPDIIKLVGATHFTTSPFVQGSTVRWGLAWTFDEKIVLSDGNHFIREKGKKERPPVTFCVPDTSMDEAIKNCRAVLERAKISITTVQKEVNKYAMEISGKEDTWSYHRRKRREEIMAAKGLDGGNGPASSNMGGNNFDEEPSSKKMKLEYDNGDGNEDDDDDDDDDEDDDEDDSDDELQSGGDNAKKIESNDLLHGMLVLRFRNAIMKDILVQMTYMGGKGGRNACNDFMMFLKNQWYPDKNVPPPLMITAKDQQQIDNAVSVKQENPQQ